MPKSIAYDGAAGPGTSAIKNQWRGTHFGPGSADNNYQAGGYNLTAASLGLSSFENVGFAARSQNNGTYYAVPFPPLTDANANGVRAVPPTYVTVKWYISANGAEVSNNTNLGNEAIGLTALGN